MRRRDLLTAALAGAAAWSLPRPSLAARKRVLLNSVRGSSIGAIAGNTGIAFTQNSSTNTVNHSKTLHPICVAGSALRISFANWVLNGGGEIKVASANSWYDFALRASVKYNGVFYPLLFNGARDVNVPFGSYVTCDPLPFTVTPPGMLEVTTRRTALLLAASSYNVLASHQTHAAFGEGNLGSTNTALDFTMGGVPGGDVAFITLANAAGVLTPTLTGTGAGYTGAASMTVLDPTFETGHAFGLSTTGTNLSGQPVITVSATTGVANGQLIGGHPNIPAGATVLSFVAATSVTISANLLGNIGAASSLATIDPTFPGGAGFGGFINQSGGALTTISQTSKGFHYSTRTVGAIAGGGGFGQTTQAWGPCAITGVQARKGVTLQLIGHSITRGCGADDAAGDEFRNFGITERAFRSRYPSIQNSYIGNTIGAIATQNYALTYAMVASVCKPTHVYICNPTNDFAAGTPATLAQAKSSMLSIIAREHALGKKVITETHEPRCTSSDSFATTVNQTPLNAPFTVGGDVDLYDAWLLAGGSGADYVLDVRPFTRDATLTDRWKVDPITGALTGDGTHPGIGQVDALALAMVNAMPFLS